MEEKHARKAARTLREAGYDVVAEASQVGDWILRATSQDGGRPFYGFSERDLKPLILSGQVARLQPAQSQPPPADVTAEAERVVQDLYWKLYRADFGSRFHAFLEWCGVLSAYLGAVRDTGIDPRMLNAHTELGVLTAEHRLVYLAEKLHCILAPLLRGADEATRRRFLRVLLEGK